ncbi:MAG: hypothetical protein M3P50_06905 [Actinomycetota bacterium]|nr:hypothetical protein [Actinomycetota bacterium]
MIEPVLAHPSHWLVQVAYLAPLAALVVLLVAGKVRERRQRRSDADSRD